MNIRNNTMPVASLVWLSQQLLKSAEEELLLQSSRGWRTLGPFLALLLALEHKSRQGTVGKLENPPVPNGAVCVVRYGSR